MIAPCSRCGTELAPQMLACPQCRALVHKERLGALSKDAEEATARGDDAAALAAWRQALELLPTGIKQRTIVEGKIAALETPATAEDTGAKKKLGGAGAITAGALLLWKLKSVLAFVVTKGKFLLLGLTKASTFFSMFLALGVYWAAWGWKFAAGLIVSIYVHEIGHVAALSRLGIRASAPLFIPGFGAVVRLKEYPKTPGDDARVGLAGPIWGLGAAVVSWLIGLAFESPFFIAIARIGALINLFNLLPVWQLDGARGFRGLTKTHRWYVVAAIGAAWFFVGDGMLLLVLLVAGFSAAVTKPSVEEPDWPVLVQFVVLVGALSALLSLDPGIGLVQSGK